MTLPVGFRVRLAQKLIAADGGQLLVGGSPLTALRLSDRAAGLIGPDGISVTDAASRTVATRLLATNLGVPDVRDQPACSPQELTVVIPVRDRAEQLDRALAALAPVRSIVVDDASVDPQAIAVVARRHSSELVRLRTNVGPAAARNLGLARVTTTFVGFVDSDVEVSAGDLLELTRHFADPDLTLVGPRIVGLCRSSTPRWFERYDEVASSLTLGTAPALVQPGGTVGWLPSACLVGRTDRLGAAFDPALRVGEDVDFVWRVIDAGGRVRYEPTVTARHDTRSTLQGWLGRKAYYGSGSADLARRHGDRLAPAVLSPSYALASAALLMRLRWSPLLAGLALASGARSVRTALPEGPGSTAVASRVALRGLGWSVRQESALLLRHWWPAAAGGALVSRHARRAVVSALVVDAVLAVMDRPDSAEERISPATQLAGRRLDDLAYGAGLWWGAFRARSPRALLPRRPRGR